MRARWASILLLFTLAARPAAAQTLSEIAGETWGNQNSVVDQEVINASRAAEEAAKTWATTPKPWARTGSGSGAGAGAVGTLLINSGTVICAGWLLSYERAMTELATEGAFHSDAGTALIGALQRLKRQIERVCDPILSGVNVQTGGGGGEGGVPLRADCPECDDEKEAYQRAEWAYQRAKFEFDRAHARTTYLYTAFAENAAAARQVFVTTPQEAEREEDQKAQDLDRAQRIRDTARQAWLDCVEACHKARREQVGFLDGNRKYLVAGLVGVASTVAIVAGGGSNTPVASASTPVTPVQTTPQPPVSTAPPVQTTPPAMPAPPSPAGEWVCGACQATNDVDNHERALQICRQIANIFGMTISGSMLRIAHPAPWITLEGPFAAGSMTFTGTGTGPIGSFSNVSARGQVTFQSNGSAITSTQIMLTLGENGVFPGGRPVTYAIMLVRR